MDLAWLQIGQNVHRAAPLGKVAYDLFRVERVKDGLSLIALIGVSGFSNPSCDLVVTFEGFERFVWDSFPQAI